MDQLGLMQMDPKGLGDYGDLLHFAVTKNLKQHVQLLLQNGWAESSIKKT